MRRLSVALVSVVLTVVACSTVPYTERTRIILIPESQENAIGLEAYQEVLSGARLSSNPQYNAWVQNAGRRVAAVAERPDFDWEFNVIEDKQVNAFCLPGGKVAFYTGIMPICRDETGVGVVMGHEVAHAVARHGGERMSQSLILGIGAVALAIAFNKESEETQGAILAVYGIGTSVALALPFSRKHESEADHIGLMLMAKAGYDPREAPRFWERMVKASEGQPPEFLSTHPSHERRIEDLEDLVPEALGYYEQATGKKIDYHRRVIKGD